MSVEELLGGRESYKRSLNIENEDFHSINNSNSTSNTKATKSRSHRSELKVPLKKFDAKHSNSKIPQEST